MGDRIGLDAALCPAPLASGPHHAWRAVTHRSPAGKRGLRCWLLCLGASAALSCGDFVASQCAVEQERTDCSHILRVQPERLSRTSDTVLQIELANESSKAALAAGAVVTLRLSQGEAQSSRLPTPTYDGQTLSVRISRSDLAPLHAGSATLHVELGARRMEHTLTVLTPPDYSHPPKLRETLGFVPDQARFHPLWWLRGMTRAPLVIQGKFVSSGLAVRQQVRACWLDADLQLPEVSDDPATKPEESLKDRCPLSDLNDCSPAFDTNGCLLELCSFGTSPPSRYLMRKAEFEPVPVPVPLPWASKCPPDASTPRFAYLSRIESDPRSNLVGILRERAPAELGLLRTLQFLSGGALNEDLPQALEAQDFQRSLLALGDLDQPVDTPPARQTGDAISLSADGTLQILIQQPDQFRRKSDLSSQLTSQLKNPVQPAPAVQAYRGIALADLDGDGWLDIAILAATPAGALRLVYASNLGGGRGFAQLVELPLSAELGMRFAQASWALGDIDGDGNIDIVLSTQQPSVVPRANAPLGLLALLRNEAE